MSTTDTERYIRITLLTFEGGTWISKEILIREVCRLVGSPTLDAVLRYNKARFTQKRDRKEITQRQYEALFPSSGTGTDIDEWDLSLIIKVVLLLFENYLQGKERDDLREILRIRNEVLCHATQPSIKERDFNRHWAALTLSISGLAYDARTKRHVSDLVKKLSGDPLDLQSSIDKVAELCRHDEHMENVLASLTKLERRLNEVATGVVNANTKLDYVLIAVRELQRSHEVDKEAQCRVEIPLLESTVCLSGKNEGEVRMSENIILKVLQAAIRKAEDPTDNENIKTAVNQSLDYLKRTGGHTESAENGSIILKIRCYTLMDLETFLSLFLTTGHRFRLTRIESALNALLEDVIKVELVLPEATINILRGWIDLCLPEVWSTSSEDQVHEYKRTIKLGIRCDSAEAAVDVIRYLQSSDSANRMNQIAEAVSGVVHDQIKIEATPDIEGFAQALNANIASTKLSLPVTDRPAYQAGTSSELTNQPEQSTGVSYETVLSRDDSNPLHGLHDENVTSTETRKSLKYDREEEEVTGRQSSECEMELWNVEPEEQIMGSEEQIQEMKELSIAKESELKLKVEKRMVGMGMKKRISEIEKRIPDVEKRTPKIEKRLVEIEGQLLVIKEKLPEIENRLQGNETSMFESEKQMLTSEKRMLECEKRVLEYEKRVSECIKRVMELEKQLLESEKRILESINRILESENRKLESEKQVLDSEKRILESEQVEFKSEDRLFESELEKQRLTSEKRMLECEKRVLEYEKRVLECMKRVMELEKQLLESEKRILESTNRILESENRTLESEKQVLDSEKRILESEQVEFKSEDRLFESELEKRMLDCKKRILESEKEMLKSEKQLLESEKQMLESEKLIFEHENRMLNLYQKEWKLECDKNMMLKPQKRMLTYEKWMLEPERRGLELEKWMLETEKRMLETVKLMLEPERRGLELGIWMLEPEKRRLETEKWMLEPVKQSLDYEILWLESDKRMLEPEKWMLESEKQWLEGEQRRLMHMLNEIRTERLICDSHERIFGHKKKISEQQIVEPNKQSRKPEQE